MTEADHSDQTSPPRRSISTTPSRLDSGVRRVRMRLRRLGVRLRVLGRPLRITLVCLLALGGAGLGVWVGGSSSQEVGPVHTTMRLSPSLDGGTILNLPPLGALEVDSHQPPLRLNVTVDEIDSQKAETIFEDPRLLEGLEEQVIDDLQSGLIHTGVRSAIVAVLGASVVALVVTRRWRPVLLATAVGVAATAGSYGIAWATLDQRAIAEPRYTGLMAGAPSLVGNVSDIVEDFDEYRGTLAELVTNVTQLYHASSTLPTYEPDDEVITLMHISDLELNPYAWDIVGSVSRQYSADFIVDTGDTTDHGSSAENSYLDAIEGLGVPYVWVRGNHDSSITQEYMESLENVTVLDGEVAEVEGVRLLGAGDPRFTPDRSNRNTEEENRAVITQAEALANVAQEEDDPIDVLAYHDTAGAPALDGHGSLLLTGHLHHREREIMPGGTRLMQEGSTGADGLRALEQGDPAPVELSLLYLDAETQQLQAWDEITMGGLGLTSAQIERFHVDLSGEEDEADDDDASTPSPFATPTEPVPTTPLDRPTLTSPPEDDEEQPADEDEEEPDEGDGDDGPDAGADEPEEDEEDEGPGGP